MYSQSVPALISKNVGNTLTNYKTWGGIIYNVKEYGAKGDGVTDDTAAINAAIVAASEVNGCVLFPPSSGTYRVSSCLHITPNFSVFSYGGAVIESLGSVTDGVIFDPGNYYGRYDLPNIINFVNGAGLLLNSSNLARIHIDNIANCKNGLILQASGSASCLDNTVIGQAINSCRSGAAVRVKATETGATLQGNVVDFNFFTGNLYGIYFDSPASSSINWDDNYFEIAAIEGFGATGSKGISANNGGPPGRVTFRATTFFGGFDATPWVEGGGNNNIYELAFVGNNIPYGAISMNGVGNIIRNIGGNYSGAITGTAIQAATASNSRSTYNGGNAVYSNKQYIQMDIPVLASGATKDYWIYSPFTTGYSHILSITPHFSQPLAVQCIEDSSIKAGIDGNASDNQIHIRLIALGAVSAGQQQATVTIGI